MQKHDELSIKGEKAEDPSFDSIAHFLAMLEPNLQKLDELGLKRDDISIWRLYEYDCPCNLEFSPQDMMRLGEHGPNLCVACWRGPSESAS